MSYALPTPSDFKSQFARDFPYAVPAWGAAGSASILVGSVTAIAVTAGGQGYTSAPAVALSAPPAGGTQATATATITAGRVTGFTITAAGAGYTTPPSVVLSGGAGDGTDLDMVTDDDINGAILDAQFNTNQDLFENQALYTRAYLFLAAHLLIEKLLMAGEGLASQYGWLTAAKAVGDVSESFEIPDRVKADPMLASFSKTRYGAMYLQIISPQLVGGVFVLPRRALP